MKIALRFAALGAVVAVAASASAQWQIQALDSLNFTGGAVAAGINKNGQVVGYAYDADGNSHAMLWSSGAAQELGYFSSQHIGEAYRINDNGQIVGKATSEDGSSHATFWNAGVATDLGTLGGTFSFANDINDNGVVVGSAYIANGGSHAFAWTQGGGMVDYGSLESANHQNYAGFNGINNAGLKVGTGYRLFSPYKAVWSLPNETGITMINPDSQFATAMANAVNNNGTVVGYYNLGSGPSHAVIFTGVGTFNDLGTMGLGESRAFDVSDSGIIVGDAFGEVNGEFYQTGFVYQNGLMLDLMSLLPQNSGWTAIIGANGVNNLGQIVGTGIYNGEQRAFVLSQPVPEPATLAALGMGALALLRRRKKA